MQAAQTVHRAQSDGLKVALFDDAGNLLWYSPDWFNAVEACLANPAEMHGHHWLEFVRDRDMPVVHAWLDAGEGAAVRFVFHGAARDCWLMVALVKHRVGSYWLAVGDNRLARPEELL